MGESSSLERSGKKLEQLKGAGGERKSNVSDSAGLVRVPVERVKNGRQREGRVIEDGRNTNRRLRTVKTGERRA